VDVVEIEKWQQGNAILKGVKRLLAQDEVPAFIGRLITVIEQQFPEGSELSVPSHLTNAGRA